ncbi:GTPase [Oerskovia flava]|uniref:GTPase n=1 Tax=Oerskovia flava TaxID=2986422 RepID=UPI00223EAC56|nr:GTPase [Oerskovia sp. JB1-3-2]
MRTEDAAVRTASSGSGASDELGVTVFDVVRDLRRDVAVVELPLDLDGARDADASRGRLVAQLDEHLLPRLKELSSPAVVVVAGSTGAGKSTLYNSLLGDEVSEAGVLRPTTREPVLAYNPLDADVFVESPTTQMARVIQHDGVPRGTALLDAPDLDSLLDENRRTAAELLEAADLWLFVTTAARYGDALPWQALGQAMERGASVAMILNRVPRENLHTIRGDLLARLREHGMDGVPLFVVPDVGPHEGLLERTVVAPIARWLTMLAGPDRSRAVIVRTLKGALGALPAWVEGIADAVEHQVASASSTRELVRATLPDVEEAARASVVGGVVAGGSVAARWAQVNGADRIDRVRVRAGVVRSTRRRGRARAAALVPFLDELRAATARTLVAIGTASEDVLVTAMTAPTTPAGAVLAPDRGDEAREAAREQAAADHVAAWVAHAERAIEALQGVDEPDVTPGASTRRAEAAVKAFGAQGLAALCLAAAAGADDVHHLVRAVLGEPGDAVVQELTTDLADRAVAVAAREADDVLAALDVPALAPDAAVGLRVRLAELRRFM